MAEIRDTTISGVFEIFPRVFEDSRGFFFESFREDWLLDKGVKSKWIQDNQSYSQKGTVRGLHFQTPPFAQAKLVRVVQGSVLDVVVDLRKDSPTFGDSFSTVLDSKRHNALYVPEGFAHGFSVLEDAIFVYKCSAYYHKESEGGIKWDDPALGIDWKLENPIISKKDEQWEGMDRFMVKYNGGF